MSPQLEIQLIAIIVAIACAIPGVFLVLRHMAMMTDAITHTLLLGIVLAFLVVLDLNSPYLMIGATLMGVLTAYLVELLNKTQLVSEDSAVGVIFPLLFSLAIILISRYAGSVHLDTDSVLLGELAFAPFNRLIIAGYDIGPKGLYTMGIILVMNILLVVLFFKELKLATFDHGLASVLGFSPTLIHYGLMTSVSMTAVGAFEAVGSILVIAFMIGPPITAYLLTTDLKKMLFLSGLLGSFNAVMGYQFASLVDVSISGSMAVATGVTFFLVFLLAPERGIFTVIRRRKQQKIDFALKSLLFHLYRYETKEMVLLEAMKVENLSNALNWDRLYLEQLIFKLEKQQWVIVEQGIIRLTDLGREYAMDCYKRYLEV